MSESRLSYLFQAYFNKSATVQDRNELMELVAKSNNDEELKMLMTEAWFKFSSQSQVFSEATGDEILSNILQKDKTNFNTPVIEKYNPSFKWMRIAAAAVLIIAVAGISFWFQKKQPQQPIAQSKKIITPVSKPITPGGNKAVLTLSDGSNIILDSTLKGELAKQGSVKVIKLNTVTVAYNDTKENSKEIVYNTLSTPSGGQYQLILPDGTKVWLDASSSIRFPTAFQGKERNVTLTGEAYFEVAKNADMPFKITVKDMAVEVLGTHFNVMAYEDESSMNTTLLEGSVKITKAGVNKMLVPGQQSVINNTGEINIINADIEEVMAWKNGLFQFNAFDIKKVMRQISRWYDVEVVYENEIPSRHFTGMISRSNDISQVLKILQSGGVKFRIEGRKIIVI